MSPRCMIHKKVYPSGVALKGFFGSKFHVQTHYDISAPHYTSKLLQLYLDWNDRSVMATLLILTLLVLLLQYI